MLRWNAFPFVRYVGALMSGIVGYLTFPTALQLVFVLLILSVLGMLAAFTVRLSSSTLLKGLTGFMIFVCTGWLFTFYHTARTDSNNLIHVQQPIRAYEAVVSSQAENRTKTFRLELEVRRLLTNQGWSSASGRLIVYIDKTVPKKPQYGDLWLVRGAPRTIDPPLNPGEFNYKRHLANRGIYHQQYLRPTERIVFGYQPVNRLTATAYAVNAWADSVFTSHLGAGQEFAIVKAMILGVRDGIDPDLQQAYSAAGAVHVLSVSGLHVGVLFAAVSFMLGFLKRRKGGTYLFAIIMLGLLWFYALMTGFSAPVLRSAFMFNLLLIGQTIGRTNNPLNTLAASAFLILLLDPYALTTAGFQLSYLAVGALILWHRSLYQTITFRSCWADWGWKITAVSLVAQLVTFPLGVFYFHQFPTYFWLANPIVIPVSSLVLILAMGLLVVGWIPYVGVWVGKMLFGSMWLLNQCIIYTEKLPNSILTPLMTTSRELGLLYAIILSGIALLVFRERRYVWLVAMSAVLLVVSVGWTTIQRKSQRLFIVHFVPHQSAISFVQANAAVLLTKEPVSAKSREVTFYIRNTWDSLGVSRIGFAQPDRPEKQLSLYQNRSFSLVRWQAKSVLILNKLTKKADRHLPIVVDFLVISRNAVQDWNQLKSRVVARNIIFDDSNKTLLTDRLLAEARVLGISCHSVRQQGAYLVRM
ncbi:ComEC/Rec2 family competence protein [Larkinella rosea]|uniref:ComEC family competence protein n=1 Tax=Larkinella rosea TaxID=2025312 RepID=A0A3P1C1K2_9BACT|nr:ComEC/Rec2 family competence protein [Larkinella rosea]RRB06943.1 ComEC family competence protein [Larkinella rosea]